MLFKKLENGNVVPINQEVKKGAPSLNTATGKYECSVTCGGHVLFVGVGDDAAKATMNAQGFIDALFGPFKRVLPGGLEIVVIDDFKLSGCECTPPATT